MCDSLLRLLLGIADPRVVEWCRYDTDRIGDVVLWQKWLSDTGPCAGQAVTATPAGQTQQTTHPLSRVSPWLPRTR
jgi:hypothetical protein